MIKKLEREKVPKHEPMSGDSNDPNQRTIFAECNPCVPNANIACAD